MGKLLPNNFLSLWLLKVTFKITMSWNKTRIGRSKNLSIVTEGYRYTSLFFTKGFSSNQINDHGAVRTRKKICEINQLTSATHCFSTPSAFRMFSSRLSYSDIALRCVACSLFNISSFCVSTWLISSNFAAHSFFSIKRSPILYWYSCNCRYADEYTIK